MLTNSCTICGIPWQDKIQQDVCPRCKVKPQERSPLADAAPLDSSEIETIKVAMLTTGFVWKE
jgi:uncharacterized Zn finger protein (UPF0148 family)